MKRMRKTLAACLNGAVALLLSLGAASCKNDDKIDTGTPFDPSRPLTVTGFTPESGGYQEQIIVKSSNFGNDKSMVSLSIGGKYILVSTDRDDNGLMWIRKAETPL